MQANHKPDAGNNANYISKMWFKCFPYWPLFLLLAAFFLGLAWYKLQHSMNVYAASATLLIKDEKKGPDESKLVEALNPLFTPKSVIENEILVLKSKTLMQQVVEDEDLCLYAPVYEEGKFVPSSAYRTSPIKIVSNSPDSITGTDKVYFEFDKNNSRVIIGDNKYPLNTWNTTPYGVLKFVPNTYYYASHKGRLYFSLMPPKYVASMLVGQLMVVSSNKLSTVLTLAISDEDPLRAESILNKLVSVYNDASLNDKNSLAKNTLVFIDERLNLVTHELDSIENNIKRYKSKTGAVDLGAQAGLYLSSINATSQKVMDVEWHLAVLDRIQNDLANNSNSPISLSTIGMTDPTLVSLIDKLYGAQAEYEKQKNISGEKSPTILNVTKTISEMKTAILDNIKNQRKTLASTKEKYSTNSAEMETMLSNIPQKDKEIIDISRERQVKTNVYNFLLQKRDETNLSLASSVPDSRIVDQASSSYNPISPNHRSTYMKYLIIAMLLGVAFVSIKEMFTRTILFRHEIESATSLPIIGEINYNKSKNPLITGDNNRSFLAEQFRKLRASLTFMGIDSKRKKILITSTISGEGKSFVAANLGLSLALTGKKVVLVELDLSNPTLSQKLNVHSNKGVSDYLNGAAGYEEIIKQAEAHENLFVIPSGPLPDNPSEMVMNSKVKDMLTYLDKVFDFIIIDTAPVGPMTDAYILSSYCDATLYVVRHGYTPKIFVARIDQENKINQLKNPAIIFNAIKSRGFSKNSYGFGYGYGYGYVYNEKQNKKRLVVRKGKG